MSSRRRGLVLCALVLLFAIVPGALAYPLIALGARIGVALLYRGYLLHRVRKRAADRR